MKKLIWVLFFMLSYSVVSGQDRNSQKDSIKLHVLIADFFTIAEKKPKVAKKRLDTILQIAEKNNYKKANYYYHFFTGYYCFITHEFDTSLKAFNTAVTLAKQQHLKKEEIDSNNWISNIFYLKGNKTKAKEIYQQNRLEASKIQYTEGVVSSYFGLASLAENKKTSLLYLLTIDSICKVHNYKSAVLANTYQNISSIYLHNLKNRKKGIEYLQLFLQTSYDVNYYSGINYASTMLGDIAFEDKNYRLASKYFNANLKRDQKSNLQIGIAHNLLSLASIDIELSNYKKAEKKLLNAIKIFTLKKDENTLYFANLSLAKVYIGLKKYKKAEKLISESKNVQLDNSAFRKMFLETSILFFTSTKKYKKALKKQEELLQLEKDITNNDNLKEFLALENKYKATERRQKIHELQTNTKRVETKNKRQKNIFITLLIISFIVVSTIVFAYLKKQKTAKILNEKIQTLNTLNPFKKDINNADKRFLLELNKTIDNHLLDPDFSAKKFADSMHLSRMQLHRKLKKITHLTTSEFMKIERLKIAEKLLKNSTSTVSEIAFHCGFKDTSYFSKQFKSVYKKTPSNYRKD